MELYDLDRRKAVQRETADIPEGLLRKMYLKKEMSTYQIEEKTGLNRETVRLYLEKYGIERRDLGGENHPRWNPNISNDERDNKRILPDYVKWRKGVYQKFNNTCQVCGSNDDIQAHHLEGYHDRPDLRTDIDNGVVLCRTCHCDFHHTYGVKGITKEKFIEFKNKRKIRPNREYEQLTLTI